MLFKKITVLQITALLLAAAFAFVVAACDGGQVSGSVNQTPTADQYEIAGGSASLLQTMPNINPVQVNPKAGASPGDVTVHYEGTAGKSYTKSQNVPTEAGTYLVIIEIAAAPGWNAATINMGALVIIDPSLKTPQYDDYTIGGGGLNQTAGSVTAITVTVKTGGDRSPSTPAVKYNNSVNLPQTVGDYTVTFEVAAATGWNSMSFTVGTLSIDSAAKNYITGENALDTGVSTNVSVKTLTLQPGNDNKEINLNWYSDGAASGKVAKVRFARGTFTAGTQLVTAEGTAGTAGTSTWHKVTVKGLRPGNYEYMVSSDDTNWTEAYKFTVPDPAKSWKFAVIADPQLHASSWDKFNRYQPVSNAIAVSGSTTEKGWIETMQKIVAAGVSFIASGGDQVDTTTNGNENEYNSFFAPQGLRSLPFAPVSGNHDRHRLYNYHYNWAGQDQANISSVTTDGVESGRNYYYLYNNILFVVLDTAPYPGQSDGSPSQSYPYIEKFRQIIQAAKAAHPASTYDWLIVQHHKSTASVAVHLADRDIQSYVEAGFEKLMSDENVDFVLAGHDHVYARSYPLQGKDGGQVSAPDKTTTSADLHTVTAIPGKPIYLTFTTGSGLKYYSVYVDRQFSYTNADPKLYISNNAAYPYLGDLDTGTFLSSKKGSNDWLDGFTPVSNAAWVQPYIPSYSIVEVDGKTITFKTYPIADASGTSTGAAEAYNYKADTPYDWVTVTKN